MGHAQGVLADHPDRREADSDRQAAVVAVAQEDELLHFVAGGHDQRGTVQLGEYPNAAAVAQTAGGVQGGFPGVQKRLKPGEGGVILQDAEAGADHAQGAAVGAAADGLVLYLDLGVGGDERDQFHVPRQPRLLAGLRPVVQVILLESRAESETCRLTGFSTSSSLAGNERRSTSAASTAIAFSAARSWPLRGTSSLHG